MVRGWGSGFDAVRFALLEDLSDCRVQDGLERRETGGRETREKVDALE